jgi:hypothetical protein
MFGDICSRDGTVRVRTVMPMMETLVIVGGVLVGLLVLLALIVSLSARPAAGRGTTTATRTPGWVVDSGQKHPDAWAPLSNTSTSIRATR